MPTLYRPNTPPRAVKNLGWLRRNWRIVTELGFVYNPDKQTANAGELWAKCRDGSTYVTRFARLSIAWLWLDRPVFRGLPFKLTVPANHDGAGWSDWTIGDPAYRAIAKLAKSGRPEDYAAFRSTLRLVA